MTYGCCLEDGCSHVCRWFKNPCECKGREETHWSQFNRVERTSRKGQLYFSGISNRYTSWCTVLLTKGTARQTQTWLKKWKETAKKLHFQMAYPRYVVHSRQNWLKNVHTPKYFHTFKGQPGKIFNFQISEALQRGWEEFLTTSSDNLWNSNTNCYSLLGYPCRRWNVCASDHHHSCLSCLHDGNLGLCF